MARSGATFRSSIPAAELSAGIDRYAIVVRADTNTAMGRVEFSYPSSGSGWESFDVVTLEEMRAAMAKEILSRAKADIQLTMKETGKSEYLFTLHGLPSGGRAYLYLKRPGEKSFTIREMARDGDICLYRMGEKESQAGYRYYYFVLSVQDKELGLVEAVYPQEGQRAPFDLTTPSGGMKGR